MPILIVVNNPKNWPLSIPGVDLVSARDYLTNPHYSVARGIKLFNLCRSYRYQSTGYYVSLLASARGHKPIPDIITLRDMHSPAITRIISEDIEEDIQEKLKGIQSNEFELSIYFGKNMAAKYDRLSLKLFNLFEAPMLRARFEHHKKWELVDIRPISMSEIPESHRQFVIEQAVKHFERPNRRREKRENFPYELAILHDPMELAPPSDERALKKFIKAAESLGMETDLITRDEFGRVAEYDALFIRTTTNVNHYTYQFGRRAEAEDLVVIDDPESIIRCSNKVYLAELLKRLKIPSPKTAVIHKDNLEELYSQISYPCVLKLPDSSFSQGVIKVEDETSLYLQAEKFFGKSDLLIAQEYIPTTFDWRIGVLDRAPLYACKYYMARRHWQIIRKDETGKHHEGKVETLPIEKVPSKVIKMALKATDAIGDGFYGVDIKQCGNAFYLIEVNDNPNIEAGYEDAILKDQLYLKVMQTFLTRIKNKKSR